MPAVRFTSFLALVALLAAICIHCAQAGSLEQDWNSPPSDARIRAYWWWLNGNVTAEAITRDLEEMKAKGWGGALICDADGSSQDGNDRVPHGPTFLSPEWRKLYKHALREADRLGLEMSLNIQSGWNLGGPMVPVQDAAKKLVWSERSISGSSRGPHTLPAPPSRDDYFRDLFVVAYQKTRGDGATLTASSSQVQHPPENSADNRPDTFWVSSGDAPGGGPTPQKPQWLMLDFGKQISANRVLVRGRAGYGPSLAELQVSQDGKEFQPVARFRLKSSEDIDAGLSSASGRFYRLLILGAHDPRVPDAPRNVQIAEFQLLDEQGRRLGVSQRAAIQNWQEKAMHKALHFSAPDTSPLFSDYPPAEDEEEAPLKGVLDLTRFWRNGKLHWNAPAGEWVVFRFGCTVGDHSRVSTSSEGWQGFALDVLDSGAFNRYWDSVVQVLIDDAGSYAGKTLRYLHTDSWEVEAINWTPSLREEFRRRRGYDLVPYLPVLAGRIIEDRRVSNRFMHDFRKTLGDLAVDNHFRVFKERAHKHGMEIHPESGGPHAVPIDAQRCLGVNDAPMSEFWAWSWRHRVGDSNRFFVKQPASAAHAYGRKLVLAEGFTTIGPHWQERVWDNLKPSFDKAVCEGLNLLVWHAVVCSPESMGMPGQQYFAGTHFNPNTTWWSKSAPFVEYMNRIQAVMQQGLFVADVCYFYGDHVPNFSQLKSSDPAGILPGFDYDVVTEEVILKRMQVRNGLLVLPDGMSYRMMVLPQRDILSLPVLEKLREFVRKGATIIGPAPVQASSLRGYPGCDQRVQDIAQELWGGAGKFKGRVIDDRSAREVLRGDGVSPDFECLEHAGADVDYIHRRSGTADIYFIANRSNRVEQLTAAFRVNGKVPEIWDPVTGERRAATEYRFENGRTLIPLWFAPCGSWLVVFREPAAQPPSGVPNHVDPQTVAELNGPWQVRFDPRWGGPAQATFETLTDWSQHPDPRIKFYSGTAVYTRQFLLEPKLKPGPVFLDLGHLRELAEVRLNGRSLGILWAPPFRVDLRPALKPGQNALEVEVVNFWPNRVIGDRVRRSKDPLTRTNIRKLTSERELMDSGLFGPVTLKQLP